ncbi:SIS domain-containing protein [Paenibacillus sp. 1_12]|uniref:SIS domain-containing protein n=1 Tax=Paenibacillus sp. 1_12 TaxID=1566278 RepID=UPI0008EEA609|nr:SIS domain-containing protein [Paenibacillus sp. 1_12]SFM47387.1 SIS domain-containing protein [Paenibacillus sp. 1_12]
MEQVMQQYHDMLREMYRYYRSQPSCMEGLLSRRKEIVGGFARFYNELKPDRVYLIGSGSSLNACKAASEYMETTLGVEITCAPPSKPPVIRGSRPLVLVVSQSGKSSNTVALLEELRGEVPTVSFTAGDNNPVARIADLSVDISVGEETVGPKTRGFTGTVLCLYIAALEAALLGGNLSEAGYGKEIGLLEKTIGYGEQNLEACENFYRAHLDDLKTARHFLFVGKGPAAAVGEEDTLKVLETLCLPSAGYEFEEFLHGPPLCINEETALFLFNSGDKDSVRMEKLADITRKASKNSYIIDRTGSMQGDHILRLNAGDSKFMSPFVDVYFGQLISALLTQELGIVRHPAVRSITSDMGTRTPDAGK